MYILYICIYVYIYTVNALRVVQKIVQKNTVQQNSFGHIRIYVYIYTVQKIVQKNTVQQNSFGHVRTPTAPCGNSPQTLIVGNHFLLLTLPTFSLKVPYQFPNTDRL